MNNDNSNRATDGLIAFGLGLLAGVVLGIVLAPASGTETRRKIGNFAGKVKDTAVEGAEKASEFVKAQARRADRGFRAAPSEEDV